MSFYDGAGASRYASRACTLICLVIVTAAFPAVASAQDQTFDARGFPNNRETLSQLPFEHIDPLTGNLLLTFTDLTLPGNAGFDLEIRRTYNSKIYVGYTAFAESLREDSWAGVGWTLHFGRVTNYLASDPPPLIEMPDGSVHEAFPHVAPPPGCSSCFVTREHWIYDRNADTLTLPSGVVYQFDHTSFAGGEVALYATRIEDAFGNTITVQYMTGSDEPWDGIASVTQDLGNGQQRTVTFSATPRSQGGALTSMSFQGRTWQYGHQNIPTQYTLLTSVAPPAGQSWQFSYNTNTIPRYEVTSLTTPGGGTIAYAYSLQQFFLGAAFPHATRAVVQRTIGGRGIPAGSWTYAYAQGAQFNQTVISAPCQTITYGFSGVGNYGAQGDVWRIGLPLSKTTSSAGSVLESAQSTWNQSALISNWATTVGHNHDSAIFVPLLTSRVVTRSGQTFTATHTYSGSNFNDYGRPSSTTETGQLTRSIARTFQYGFSRYIVDKVASETIAGGGDTFTTTYTYSSSAGFLMSRNIYGVTTSYVAGTRGDVSRETNARGDNTDYTYSWGRVASIATPEYTLTRSINGDGTVASETRRGFQTTFTYDALMRPLVTDPPAGNNIVRSYATNGETETITRGSSSTVTTLDGFGRVSATIDNVGVRTATTYDACGRQTYESFPYTTSNIGTTMQYDALGRVTRRTHPDNEFQAFSYSNGIDVTITDENGRTTFQNWSAFAGPDDKRLVSVTDAANQITNYTYNIVGSLRTVSGIPGNREWIYNTKNQLTSEVHPENGTTTYSRDAVGNMTNRTDAKGQSTSFTYDGNNRLTAINHPGSGHDVSLAYDASDNRTAFSNSFVSSTLTYDAANRLTSRTDVIAGRSFATGYTYDGNDNVATIAYPSGRTVAYGYDGENRITSVTNGGSTTYANNFNYHPSGAITSYTAGNKLVHAQTFDNRYRISTLNAGGALSLTYGYDDVGNVTSINDSRAGMDQGFSYDQLDRLTSHSGWNAASYSYDGIGNRTSKSGPGGATSYSYNSGTNRISAATGAQAESVGHDANGNLTSDGAGTYGFTPDNMLETATIGGIATTYRYDGDNLRALKMLTGSTRYFVHGLAGAVLTEFEEVCSQVGPSRDYVYAGARLLASVRFPALVATAAVTSTASSRAEGLTSAGVGVSIVTTTGGPLACAITIPYTTVNGTAAAGSDFASTSGTLTFNSGSASGATQTVSVPLTDDALDENDETFTLTLTDAVGATFGATTHTVTITDNDNPPTVSINDVTVIEGDTTAGAVFTLTLSTASGRALSIDYATANETAVAESDYTTAFSSVSFDAGTTSRTLTIAILGDTIEETSETFVVNLSNAVNVTVADSSGSGSITDDDFRPAASVSDVGVTEGHSGTTNASFSVTLAAPSVRTITINYATASGTAIAGRDFTASSGIVTFTPGSTSEPITVSVLGDAVVENTETFNVNLSNEVWATLADAQGVATITTDDVFTEDSLSAGVTGVRVVHLTELRSNIDLLRTAYGLAVFSWTDANIVAGETPAKGLHLVEMRSALHAVYQAAGITPPTYTDPTITEGETFIKAVHVNELRAAIKAVP